MTRSSVVMNRRKPHQARLNHGGTGSCPDARTSAAPAVKQPSVEDVARGSDGQPIEATLRQWVEALRANSQETVERIALVNGGCVTEDIETAINEIARLRLFPTSPARDGWLATRQVVCEEWHNAVREFGLRPGTVTEKVVSRILLRIADAAAPPVARTEDAKGDEA